MSDTSVTDAGSGAGADAGAGPASSPAESAPSTPSSAPSSGAPASKGSDYDFMSEVFAAPVAPQVEPKPAPTPQQPTPPTAPTAPSPVPPAVEAAQAGVQPSAPPGTQPPQPAESQPQFDPADPISLARALAEPENYQAAIEHLAATQFRLEPKELEGLDVDPANTIPRLLAKATVFAQTQFLTQLSRVVPLMIQRQQAVSERHSSNLDRFYSAWPTLDKSKHGQAVQDLAVRFRQMFPEVPTDQMIAQLGPMVLASLGMPIVAQAAAKAAAPARTNGSQANRGGANAGFVPAAPGTVAQVQQVPDDPWGYMGLQEG
jgi:hypothetical protein